MAGVVDELIAASRSRAFLIFLLVFFVYMSDSVVVSSNDVVATRLLPISMIREGDFDLNEFTFLYDGGGTLPYWLKEVNGRILTQYPVFTAVLALPFYVIPVLMGLDAQSNDVLLLSKLAAVFLTALSALLVYWTIRRVSSERTSLLVTFVYAFGTANWPISSQDLWQHGPGELFIAASLYFLVRGLEEERFTAYAGFTLMCAVAVRPANALIAGVLSAYVLFERRREFLKYVVLMVPPAFFVAAYSVTYLGSVFLLGQLQPPAEGWTNPLVDGLLGLLASPNRGLLAYSPVFVLSLAGVYWAWRTRGERLMRYSSVAVAAALLLWSKWWAWHGSVSYGPRMLIETLPFLCLFLAKPVEAMLGRKGLAVVLAALVALSVFINFIGAAEWNGTWEWENRLEEKINTNDSLRLNSLMWDFGNLQWVYYARRFFARIF